MIEVLESGQLLCARNVFEGSCHGVVAVTTLYTSTVVVSGLQLSTQHALVASEAICMASPSTTIYMSAVVEGYIRVTLVNEVGFVRS